MSDIKQKPILFSTEMVRQILLGNKSMTRRVLKTQPTKDEIAEGIKFNAGYALFGHEYRGNAVKCPYEVGMKLWVRETWRTYESMDKVKSSKIVRGVAIEYKEGGSNITCYENEKPFGMGKWRSSIFMPRWASRITLEVTKIRVERIQDISEDDARAEGYVLIPGYEELAKVAFKNPLREVFRDIWNYINSKGGYSWESNPFVWVIEFEKI